jgi:hypothetical protein
MDSVHVNSLYRVSFRAEFVADEPDQPRMRPQMVTVYAVNSGSGQKALSDSEEFLKTLSGLWMEDESESVYRIKSASLISLSQITSGTIVDTTALFAPFAYCIFSKE